MSCDGAHIWFFLCYCSVRRNVPAAFHPWSGFVAHPKIYFGDILAHFMLLLQTFFYVACLSPPLTPHLNLTPPSPLLLLPLLILSRMPSRREWERCILWLLSPIFFVEKLDLLTFLSPSFKGPVFSSPSRRFWSPNCWS